MKVLHCTTFLLPFTETFILDQLSTPGVKHRIVGVERVDGFDLGAVDARAAVESRRGRRPGWSLMRRAAVRRLTERMIAEDRPDAMLIHFAFSAPFYVDIAIRLGIPYAVLIYGEDVMNDRPARWANPFWIANAAYARRAGANAVRIFATSRYLADRAVALGYPREKLELHPFGVALADKPIVPLPERRRSILFVGRLVEKKGADTLIRAYRDLVARKTTLSLDIVGDGPLRGDLMRLATGIPGVRFWGRLARPEVMDKMREARLFCMPSRREGFGMVCLEAQSVGTPVVGLDRTGSAETIADGLTGLCFTDPEGSDLAGVLARLETMPAEQWQAMSDAGVRRIAAGFEVGARNAALFAKLRGAITA